MALLFKSHNGRGDISKKRKCMRILYFLASCSQISRKVLVVIQVERHSARWNQISKCWPRLTEQKKMNSKSPNKKQRDTRRDTMTITLVDLLILKKEITTKKYIPWRKEIFIDKVYWEHIIKLKIPATPRRSPRFFLHWFNLSSQKLKEYWHQYKKNNKQKWS